MNAEPIGPHGLQLAEALEKLFPGEAVLGVAGGIHDLEALLALPKLEHPAGVEAAGDGLGDIPQRLLQKVDVGEIIQIDDRPQLFCQLVLGGGGLVGGEHDLLSFKAAFVRQHQLGEGGAVRAAALLPQNLQNGGGGGGLNGKIFLKARVPGKGGFQLPGGLPDALLVIEVEGGGILPGDGGKLFKGHEGLFHNAGLISL